MEIKFVSCSVFQSEASNIRKAVMVITTQTINKNSKVGYNPPAAVLTGKPIIPPPMEIPAINKTPPQTFPVRIVSPLFLNRLSL
jgi:hypothetical protein